MSITPSLFWRTLRLENTFVRGESMLAVFSENEFCQRISEKSLNVALLVAGEEICVHGVTAERLNFASEAIDS
jgi:hypothetical protein